WAASIMRSKWITTPGRWRYRVNHAEPGPAARASRGLCQPILLFLLSAKLPETHADTEELDFNFEAGNGRARPTPTTGRARPQTSGREPGLTGRNGGRPAAPASAFFPYKVGEGFDNGRLQQCKDHAMPGTLRIEVLENERSVYTHSFTGTVELGRQS